MLKLISRMLTKLVLYDSDYHRRKLLHASVVYGPNDRVFIGKHVNLQNVVLNTKSGQIHIGDFSFFGHDCMLLTGVHDSALRDRARIDEHPTSGNDIRIGRGVWISSRAIILGGVSLADNCVIAAGSVVTRDCPESAIYAGIPARKISPLPSRKLTD
jgi:acetyltransferase-like isoleucine patch superfamily enzyme